MKFLLFFYLFFFVSSNIAISSTEKQFLPVEEVRESIKFIDEPQDIQEARFIVFDKDISKPKKIETNKFKKYYINKHYSSKIRMKFKLIDYLSDGRYILYKNLDWYFLYDKENLIYIINSIFVSEGILIELIYNKSGELNYLAYSKKNKKEWINIIFDSNKNYICKLVNGKFLDKNGNEMFKMRAFKPYF